MIKKVIKKILFRNSTKHYIEELKKSGCKIGSNLKIFGLETVLIDQTRPSLVTIGDNVSINKNFSLYTHDFVSGVFLHKYKDFLNSSGKVTIGNNVRFGANCTVLKNVTIGDNCFIAAGSVVTKDIPANSLAGGVPAKVLCPIDVYYEKRQKQCILEAFEFARSIEERFNRKPVVSDFREEFHLFVDKRNIDKYINDLPIKAQLGDAYNYWLEHHQSQFADFEQFIEAVNKYYEVND